MENPKLTFVNEEGQIRSQYKLDPDTTLEEIVKIYAGENQVSCDIEFDLQKYFDRFEISYNTGFLTEKYEVFPPEISFVYYFDIEDFLENAFTAQQRQDIAIEVGIELQSQAKSIMKVIDTKGIGFASVSDGMSPLTKKQENTVVAFYLNEEFAFLTIKITNIAIGDDEYVKERFTLTTQKLFNNIEAINVIIDKIVTNVKGRL